jgi:CubicO group peptidase (beta-lactamase class C family)
MTNWLNRDPQVTTEENDPSNNSGFTAITGLFDPEFKSDESETQILRRIVMFTFLGSSEQRQEYLELGDTLSKMAELEEEDEWRIDKPVYEAACYVASRLKVYFYPAPRIFNHGPKSVVFNWSKGAKNVYLTVSSNRISALRSSPERIETRADIALKQFTHSLLLLPFIQSSNRGQNFADVLSEPTDFLD